MERKLTFVTGYFGAPIRAAAEEIASRKGRPVLFLDDMIEKRDGRSIRRICMAAGEHGYRNLEYELTEELISGGPAKDGGPVIACGDGILHDDMTRDLIRQHTLVIAGSDMDPEALWQQARQDADTWHAFMMFGTEDEKHRAFLAHHARQKQLFASIPEAILYRAGGL